MVNWKQGLFRSWILASGCWVIVLLVMVLFEGSLFTYGGDLKLRALGNFLILLVAVPLLTPPVLALLAVVLLLLWRSVVWARRGFVEE